jgi:hypothetical protein
VYRMTRDMLPTGGFNRDKARRAIRLATHPPEGGRSSRHASEHR